MATGIRDSRTAKDEMFGTFTLVFRVIIYHTVSQHAGSFAFEMVS